MATVHGHSPGRARLVGLPRVPRGSGVAIVPGIELSPEQRRGAIAALQRYFEQERDESIGELAAMLLLDFLAEEIGEIFYNKGVDDAQVLLRRQWTALRRRARGDQDARARRLDEGRRRGGVGAGRVRP